VSRRSEDSAATAAELQELISLLRATLDSTTDGILVVDRQGRISTWNRRFAEMWQMPPIILESRDDDRAIAFALDQLADPDAFIAKVRELYATPEAESFDALEFKDGRVFERYSRPQMIGGEAIGRVWSFRDVTERRRVEVSLRDERERFARAFRASPVAVSITLLDGRFIDVNDAFLRLLGHEREHALGRTSLELGVWAYVSDRARFVAALEPSGAVREFRTRFRTSSGEIRDVSVSAERIELGGHQCILAITSDLTEQRRLEEQLLQSQKLEAVGRLAGGIAHDFNNLLTTILGYSELILHSRPDDPELRVEIGEIRKASERAASLTRQLLAFSRKQVIEPRVLDVNALVAESSRMLRRIIGEDIALVTDLSPGLASVRADPVQLEQVIVNLAVNARDAMPEGGRLAVTTRPVRLDAPLPGRSGPGPGSWVKVSVADTGVGMDAATQERIFEPFFTTKEKGKGTGLGLSTAYGIVKQSGGFIYATSEVGRGATFDIYLPSVNERPAERDAEPPPPETEYGRETILLAEDEEGLRALNRRILESHGYRVLAARDAEEASTLARGHAVVDMLVTDIVMPGASGRQLARRLLQERPGLKVLYVSGYLDGSAGAEAVLEPGANFLQKPFTPDALLRRVREALDAL
jgi:PAS domain S-box-containing protein